MSLRREYVVALMLVLVCGARGLAQTQPDALPLAQLEIQLTRTWGDGCSGQCPDYTVTLRGDGSVEYSGNEPVQGQRMRLVSPDDVFDVANQFLRVRFFDALNEYRAMCPRTLIRTDDRFVWSGCGGGVGDPAVNLTLRIGARSKTVSLHAEYPRELGALVALVDRLGGPVVWRDR
jgi:hypothetical protein